MNRDEFIKIVKLEKLLDMREYLYEGIDEPSSENTYGCMCKENKWYPYRTDEKAFMVCFGKFDNESDALEYLLMRMRRRADLREEELGRDTFLKIVKEENLLENKWDLYTGIDNPDTSDVYGCMYEDGKWIPYKTDERAGVMMFGEYDKESDALIDLLETLRREARIRKSK